MMHVKLTDHTFVSAVQCGRKPLIMSPTMTMPRNRNMAEEKRNYNHSAKENGAIWFGVTSSTQENINEILGPQHADFNLFIPWPPARYLSMDYIHEFATRLLFVSVDWCRSIPSFRSLMQFDQIALLQKSWHEIFLIGIVQFVERFPFSALFAYAAEEIHLPTGHQRDRGAAMNPFLKHKFNNAMAVKNFVFSLARIDLDAMEFAYCRAIVLFNAGKKFGQSLFGRARHQGNRTYCFCKFLNGTLVIVTVYSCHKQEGLHSNSIVIFLLRNFCSN